MAKRIVSCLEFIIKKIDGTSLSPTLLFSFWKAFLEKHYTELHQYSAHLDTDKRFKPSTIKNYINDIGLVG